MMMTRKKWNNVFFSLFISFNRYITWKNNETNRRNIYPITTFFEFYFKSKSCYILYFFLSYISFWEVDFLAQPVKLVFCKIITFAADISWLYCIFFLGKCEKKNMLLVGKCISLQASSHWVVIVLFMRLHFHFLAQPVTVSVHSLNSFSYMDCLQN